jgi:hypothetical protein
MKAIVIILLVVIFVFLSAIHIYWILGGKWGRDVALPSKLDGSKLFIPGTVATVIVSGGLLIFAFVTYYCGTNLDIFSSVLISTLLQYGLYIIAAIFTLRSIGDFHYFGLFKKIKGTPFAIHDTIYFTPLCIGIALLEIFLIFLI